MSIRSVDAVERSVHETNEGFDPSRQPVKLRHRREFLNGFVERSQLGDPKARPIPSGRPRACLRATSRPGELDDVLSGLSSEIREVDPP